MSVLESDIEQACVRAVAKLGGILLKIQNARGYPDRLLVMPNGEVVWLEFKRPKGQVTPLQEFVHQKLRDMKQRVYVVRSREQFLSILADLQQSPGSLTPISSAQ